MGRLRIYMEMVLSPNSRCGDARVFPPHSDSTGNGFEFNQSIFTCVFVWVRVFSFGEQHNNTKNRIHSNAIEPISCVVVHGGLTIDLCV